MLGNLWRRAKLLQAICRVIRSLVCCHCTVVEGGAIMFREKVGPAGILRNEASSLIEVRSRRIDVKKSDADDVAHWHMRT